MWTIVFFYGFRIALGVLLQPEQENSFTNAAYILWLSLFFWIVFRARGFAKKMFEACLAIVAKIRHGHNVAEDNRLVSDRVFRDCSRNQAGFERSTVFLYGEGDIYSGGCGGGGECGDGKRVEKEEEAIFVCELSGGGV
ncbi:hypothetical protein L1987_59074 [Smallanthus sonchifolius]|uniref:Uncharacterized protein n=1 Tax=Smallanthus sonchifolius TaxID=185202 RepID=A0ACB9D539_9ASTR|nr:hypothetical protein L1987_59074 [Smallanthus sonchifolius]